VAVGPGLSVAELQGSLYGFSFPRVPAAYYALCGCLSVVSIVLENTPSISKGHVGTELMSTFERKINPLNLESYIFHVFPAN
jgi:hypothetical protein